VKAKIGHTMERAKRGTNQFKAVWPIWGKGPSEYPFPRILKVCNHFWSRSTKIQTLGVTNPHPSPRGGNLIK